MIHVVQQMSLYDINKTITVGPIYKRSNCKGSTGWETRSSVHQTGNTDAEHKPENYPLRKLDLCYDNHIIRMYC